jgi:hypothetical protein
MVKLFQEHGFTLVRNKNHQIWACPCGHHRITTTGSPCGGRGDNNAKAQIRRTLRACKTQEDTA